MMKITLLLLALVVAAMAYPQDITANLPDSMQTQRTTTIEAVASAKASVSTLRAALNATNARLAAMEATASEMENDLNVMWIIVTIVFKILLIFGISIVEASASRRASLGTVLAKNVVVISVTAIGWWAWGYGNAYAAIPDGTDNAFIGNGRVFLRSGGDRNMMEFGLWAHSFTTAAFATVIATSGLADRGSLAGYAVLALVFSTFIYPVMVHWVWAENGWLSVINDAANLGDNGMIDWSGSGVIGITAGSVALISTIIAGPRMKRFDDDFNAANPARFESVNKVYLGFGVLLLWIGSYGLTCGSFTTFSAGVAVVNVKVAVNLTLGAGAGAFLAFIMDAVLGAPSVDMTFVSAHPEEANPPKTKRTNMRAALNGVIAGIVAVLAGLAVYEPWAAVNVGAFGGIIAVVGPMLMARIKIDDPVETFSLFGLSGFWGLMMVGWFARQENVIVAYNNGSNKNFGIWYGADAEQWGLQVFGGFLILLWGLFMGAIVCGILSAIGFLRVPEAQEAWGLDSDAPAEDEEQQEMVESN